jgi:Sec-independent protein translocase protein TatA
MPFDGAFSPLHWLIVATVALLVLGPDQLPRAGREAAKAFRLVRDARTAITDELANLFGGGPDEEPDPAVEPAEAFGPGPAPAAAAAVPAAAVPPGNDGPAPDGGLEAPIPWRPVSR